MTKTRSKDKKSKTNITEQHKQVFDMIQMRTASFALMSCFVNGEPSCAICSVREEANGQFTIAPFFVAVTKGMKIEDHEGDAPQTT